METRYVTVATRVTADAARKLLFHLARVIKPLNEIVTAVDDVPVFRMVLSQKILARITKKLFQALKAAIISVRTCS